MNTDQEGLPMSEQAVSGHDDETARIADRSAVADDDIDFAEAFKLATGRCPLGTPPDGEPAEPQDDTPA
jgi:hypothetical protein